MYACPHCNGTKMFMAFKDGILVKVLEDNRDVEGLDEVKELLCSECNHWFTNPTLEAGEGRREMTGELVTITGLKGRGTIKVVATGIVFPFTYEDYENEAIEALRDEDKDLLSALREFSSHADHQLALRVKEEDNPNTWVYRLNARRLWKALK